MPDAYTSPQGSGKKNMEMNIEVHCSIYYENRINIFIDAKRVEAVEVCSNDNEKNWHIVWPEDEIFEDTLKEIMQLRYEDFEEVWSAKSMIGLVTQEKRYIFHFKKEEKTNNEK